MSARRGAAASLGESRTSFRGHAMPIAGSSQMMEPSDFGS